MTESERYQITLAAFVAYIMHREYLTQQQALVKAAELTTLTQITLFGL